MCYIVELNKKTNKFDESTMKLVDNGTWALWVGLSNKNANIRYALNVGNEYYFLDRNGEIISKDKNLNDFEYEDIARFSKMKVCQAC